MSNATQISLNNGIPVGPTGSATVSTLDALMADGGQATIGSQADAAWSGTGSGTLVSTQKYLGTKLEAVRALLAGTLSVTGGGGGPVTVADGADVTLGTKTDASWSGTGAGSLIAIQKAISVLLGSITTQLAGTLTVAAHAVTQSGAWIVNLAVGGVALTSTGNALDVNLKAATIKPASTAAAPTDPAIVVAISPNGVNANGSAISANSAPVVIASDQSPLPVNATGVDQYATHKEVAASQTAHVLGATGATGDYLAYVVVYPGAAACGVVTILDGATVVGTFAGGGTTALPSLTPFTIPVGAFCTGAAWKITTGPNVTVSAVGKFT